MFYDWLSCSQTFDQELPHLSDTAFMVIDTKTSEIISEKRPKVKIEGSYSTSINVQVSGNTLRVWGNPSRINRIDNLFGYTHIDDCFAAYNSVLVPLGFPPFTKCTKIQSFYTQGRTGKPVQVLTPNGAVIHEVHITTNVSVGAGNEDAYLSGLSIHRLRNSLPRLHTNGKTVDWLTPKGHASLIYHSVYNKAYEIELKHLAKIQKLYGVDSPEFDYLSRVHEFCVNQGVVRFEQKVKPRYLTRNNMQFWGYSDLSPLENEHQKFLDTQNKLQVSKMNLQTIADELLAHEIVKSPVAANTTAYYFNLWMSGHQFDFTKSSVKTHRARLRLLGIDIANKCNLSLLTPVRVKEVREINASPTQIPDFYMEAKRYA